ncbi:nucleosome assembly protein 1-like 1 [Bos indicus]|uniref:Nucleosome assembly protein 1-like 1 n=1 Tax=Bos indicus TaxID=9915 RepID=A0ABM4RYA8_BOSIN
MMRVSRKAQQWLQATGTPWSSLGLCSGVWSTPFYTVSPTMTMSWSGPPGPCPMVMHSSQPPSGPGEGPAPPQEQEDLAEGGEASQVPVPKSVLYFTKEASDYQCEESDEEVQEAEGEEEDSDKKPEEGPGKDLDPAEDSPGEPSCQA